MFQHSGLIISFVHTWSKDACMGTGMFAEQKKIKTLTPVTYGKLSETGKVY